MVNSSPQLQRDIVFLVADGGMEQMLRGFFGRDQFHRSLACGAFDFDPSQDIVVAPTKDPGVYSTAHELLRPYEASHHRAVVMLDAAWDGSPGSPAIYDQVKLKLTGVWDEFAVVVIDPELEAWIWQDSPHLAEVFKCPADFRAILAKSGHWPATMKKPPDPKAALDHLRRRYKLKIFNADFRKLAARISVRHCEDAAFNHLCNYLRAWFPASYGPSEHS
ncbi:methylation-associated defense system protein MAD4 [Nonomuraea sp. KM90]|uniref:methylation-associated defense system protein MAD4 n=1 Tax=Nonomuraea sp. KM90 TaxID=3457428 RepID=UPI003FCE9A71